MHCYRLRVPPDNFTNAHASIQDVQEVIIDARCIRDINNLNQMHHGTKCNLQSNLRSTYLLEGISSVTLNVYAVSETEFN